MTTREHTQARVKVSHERLIEIAKDPIKADPKAGHLIIGLAFKKRDPKTKEPTGDLRIMSVRPNIPVKNPKKTPFDPVSREDFLNRNKLISQFDMIAGHHKTIGWDGLVSVTIRGTVYHT